MLDKLANEVAAAFLKRASRMRATSRFIQLVMLVGAACVGAVAQFTEFDATGPSAWQIAGITSALIVAMGAGFIAITDEDASTELALARNALDAARDAQERFEDLGKIIFELDKAIELHRVAILTRGVIEQSTRQPGVTESDLISAMLEACERSIPIAMGMAQADRWTFCVYKADDEVSGEVMLSCIAHARAIKCDVSSARRWPAGTGLVGSAYSNRSEAVVEDLQVPSLKAVFGTAANVQKPDDSNLYRAMVAVPVLVAGMERPWGVVTATNDRPGHFSPEPDLGIDPSETVRTMAMMIELAVACFPRFLPVTAP